MNIFVVDLNPRTAAMHLCNKHIVKMPLETAQLLCTAIHELTGARPPYKPCFNNHPCGVWVRQSTANFDWLVEHGLALCDAYRMEYAKNHKCEIVIEWALNNRPAASAFPVRGATPHPLCMPDEYKTTTVVESYRQYYIGAKAKFAQWNVREAPDWFSNAVSRP